MERRTFLVRLGQTLVATPILAQTWGCGDDNNPAAPGNTGGTDSFDVTSSLVGHTHSVTFTCSELSGGTKTTWTSSNSGGHTHTLTLQASEVTQILNGVSVGPITSSNDAGHMHTWTIQKPANACP